MGYIIEEDSKSQRGAFFDNLKLLREELDSKNYETAIRRIKFMRAEMQDDMSKNEYAILTKLEQALKMIQIKTYKEYAYDLLDMLCRE